LSLHTLHGMSTPARAIDCFVVCGLPASPTTVRGTRGFVGAAGETYRPEVLESYPPTTPIEGSAAGAGAGDGDERPPPPPLPPPWPPQLALCSMPAGVDVHIGDPPADALGAKTYAVILTAGDGTLVFVACLSFLEPVPAAARVAHPALRAACARKCMCLVSRAPILVWLLVTWTML
jgi:hypothetical protein